MEKDSKEYTKSPLLVLRNYRHNSSFRKKLYHFPISHILFICQDILDQFFSSSNLSWEFCNYFEVRISEKMFQNTRIVFWTPFDTVEWMLVFYALLLCYRGNHGFNALVSQRRSNPRLTMFYLRIKKSIQWWSAAAIKLQLCNQCKSFIGPTREGKSMISALWGLISFSFLSFSY